ncbi:MAG TPA: threonine synthase [Actinomycetes bacterium]|nr:threonine synthase [Actinomycetes bacterium]
MNRLERRTAWRGVIEEFRDRLPVSASTPAVTLLEGATPLVPAPVLSARTGCEVHLKVEGANPTGSFKDRGMTVAVSRAVEQGARAVLCASTGNTSASAAAYAARAAITCAVLIPDGKIAPGKLAQALVHGATVLAIDGSFDDCLVLACELAERYPVTLVNSVNPDRIQGQKTVAFEIVEALGRAPDVHCIPVGNAGNITATWLGYREAAEAGQIPRGPAMHGFQSTGAAPLVLGRTVARPSTIATAIRIGNPASADGARRAVAESGGSIQAVTDREILAAYRLLAREEAVFAEMASAASVAGLLSLSASGRLGRGRQVVCTLTGNGLKDPDWAVAGAPAPVTIPPDARAAAEVLGLGPGEVSAMPSDHRWTPPKQGIAGTSGQAAG